MKNETWYNSGGYTGGSGKAPEKLDNIKSGVVKPENKDKGFDRVDLLMELSKIVEKHGMEPCQSCDEK